MLRTSPKPSCGGCIFQTGLSVTAFHTLTVESAEALMSQLFLPSCTYSSASTLRVCPTRSACTLRLLACHTRICPEGRPANMYLSLCARHNALLSGRVSDEIGLWGSASQVQQMQSSVPTRGLFPTARFDRTAAQRLQPYQRVWKSLIHPTL